MSENNEKLNVLMVGSDQSVKGGIVSVVKNYLSTNCFRESNIYYLPTHIEANSIKKLVYFFNAIFKFINTCNSKKIDIVHFHVSERGSFYRKSLLIKLCKLMNIKIILHHHGAEFEKFYLQSSKYKQLFISNILECVDLNIVLSERLINMISSINEKGKVEVLYNSVPIYKDNNYNADGNIILFLGRLGKRKGVYDLLKVIKKLDKEIDSEYIFYLCGDGDVVEVDREVTRLGIKHRIGHIGWINSDEKIEIFNNTIINVLPSYNEGLPMTILETMSYGIPNISTNIASIPEVITSLENGILINPGDQEALFKSIKLLCSSKEKRVIMSEKSYELINSKLNLENHISKLEKIYTMLSKGDMYE